MAPRLVRRSSLFERLQAYLNPLDFFLRVSEKLDSDDWDQWQTSWATPICIVLNVTFLLARANYGPRIGTREDDVFLDDIKFARWFSWLVRRQSICNIGIFAHTLKAPVLTYFLTILCLINTIYTFSRKRYYRLFENALDVPPSTPSAYRVRVESSPISSSPLRFLSNVLTGAGTESRLHPDAKRDVWELAVWDPKPFCLKMFCYLSPGHALVYWFFLPAAPEDPRPSVTVMTTIILVTLLSAQLILFHFFFLQQMKDTVIIHKEVLNEYDIKFVHPRTRPKIRDVGTQLSMSEADAQNLRQGMGDYGAVDTYTPTTIQQKGFRIHPNPAYAKLIDPELPLQRIQASRNVPCLAPLFETPIHQRETSSAVRPSPAIRPLHSRSIRVGDGGSLGVYSHVQSPLRKAASNNIAEKQRLVDSGASPVKRMGMHGARGINMTAS